METNIARRHIAVIEPCDMSAIGLEHFLRRFHFGHISCICLRISTVLILLLRIFLFFGDLFTVRRPRRATELSGLYARACV